MALCKASVVCWRARRSPKKADAPYPPKKGAARNGLSLTLGEQAVPKIGLRRSEV